VTRSRKSSTATGRDQLLVHTVEYFARHGVGDTSLRQLAEEIGTSHRMLLYHFGSREGLLSAVVEHVESEQRAHLATLLAEVGETGADPVAQGLRFWRAVTDAALIYGPLFFELSSHAMLDLPHAAALRPSLVESWLGPIAEGWAMLGYSPDAARQQARLDLAVARGLLHDLLITGDRAAVDAAMERYVELVVPSDR
jgi:AcrR family transcriptional regulator